jgi:glycosyltransferase involved in cell wall biosynthesis
LIMATSILKRDFPNLLIKISGYDVTKSQTFLDKVRLSSYGKYIKNLIKFHDLTSNLIFLGSLVAEDMVREYQNAHVFICPSSIENSPNSIGEAQMIGTPVIAAYVGGIPEMVTHGESGLLYRFEEVELLAQYIRRVFHDPDLTNHLSRNGIAVARQRHDLATNAKQMLSIYSSM